MNLLRILASLGDFLEHDDLNHSTMWKSQDTDSLDYVDARKKTAESHRDKLLVYLCLVHKGRQSLAQRFA